MEAFVIPEGLSSLGGFGLFIGQCLILLRLMQTGKLVSEASVLKMREDYEARIAEALARENDSKETAKIMLQANTELLKQNGTLTGELKIVGRTMYAINPALSEADHG